MQQILRKSESRSATQSQTSQTPIGNDIDNILGSYIHDINETASKSDFQCELYKAPDGQYILAFRGTDNITDLKYSDLNADVYGIFDANEAQNSYAKRTTNEVINILKQHGIDQNKLTLTGHSLGGRLAQESGNDVPTGTLPAFPYSTNARFL